MKSCIIETALGWLGLVLAPAGLRAVTLPRRDRDAALREVLALGAREEARIDELGDLPERLRRYARGEPVAFPDALDIAVATPFQRAVWQARRARPAVRAARASIPLRLDISRRFYRKSTAECTPYRVSKHVRD